MMVFRIEYGDDWLASVLCGDASRVLALDRSDIVGSSNSNWGSKSSDSPNWLPSIPEDCRLSFCSANIDLVNGVDCSLRSTPMVIWDMTAVSLKTRF